VTAYEDIMDDMNLHPDNYGKFKMKANWVLFENVNRFPEMPMHLLFLGIVKTVIVDIMNWLKLQKKYASFFSKANGLLTEIQAFGLPWLKVMPFINGKLGGWVAENYLGFSRVMVWFFDYLKFLPEPEPYLDPVTDPSTWKKKQSIDWLQAHGLISNGSAKELKAIIKEYYVNNLVPEILPDNCCNVSSVLEVVRSLQVLISNCMKLVGLPGEQLLIGCSVRVFLTKYAILEESLYSGNVPKYIYPVITLCLCLT
jgi:hypothetical protein